MRPIYETPEDRERERLAFSEYKEVMDLKGRFLQAPPLAPFDAVYVDESGKQIAIWELKVRENYSYDDLMRMGGVYLSADKFTKIGAMAFFVGFEAHMLLKTSDGLYTKRLNGKDNTLSYGGRTDRSDAKDKELVVLLKGFYKVGK